MPDAVVRTAREAYYTKVEWGDQQAGKVIDAIRNSELSDNTIIIYTSDHGENLGEPEVNLPTDSLLTEYKSGKRHAYLEELFFQYGRYLLVSSTRKGALPPNLQGVWNQYELAPWNGNYTHNINIQMNYWPCFNTNLVDLFETYADYYNAYLSKAKLMATEFIRIHHPKCCSQKTQDSGWTMEVGSCPYHVGMPGGFRTGCQRAHIQAVSGILRIYPQQENIGRIDLSNRIGNRKLPQ